jgi:GPR1/FUN34/yaaH family
MSTVDTTQNGHAVAVREPIRAPQPPPAANSYRAEPVLVEPEVVAEPSGWANSGPLCLIAFAVTTFMISLVNAKGASSAVVPMVISTGLISVAPPSSSAG